MKVLTFEEYQVFIKGDLKVKVTDKENLFYNSVCPVFSIGIDWVTCDVDGDGGTQSFGFNKVELTNEEIIYID